MKRTLFGMAALIGILAINVIPAKADIILNQFSATEQVKQPPLNMSILNRSGTSVESPTIEFPFSVVGVHCLKLNTGAPAGLLGTPDQQLFISVPGSAAGWSLSLMASDNSWTGTSHANLLHIDDRTDSGCSRDINRDLNSGGMGGLLYADPTGVTLESTCGNYCQNDINLAPLSDFADLREAQILSSPTPQIGWEGTISNIRLIQTLPANLPPDNYRLGLTVLLQSL